MDLKTSFAFYFVSLALYVIALTAMALADKRVMGTRWLAYSVLIEMVKVGLQVATGSIPRLFTTMVANELNMAAFFAMYMGLRWFVHREPQRNRVMPILLLVLMAVYCGMFLLHIPYGFQVMAAVVLWFCGATIVALWKQREERFRIPSGITITLMLVQMILVIYRAVISIEVYRHGTDFHQPVGDIRYDYSMLFIVMLANCLLIMYVWFAAAEMYSAVEATAGIDSLTGCLNRRALIKLASHEVARSVRSGMPLTAVAIDLDHFKNVNDTYGHAGGDATLCAVVNLLLNRIRSVDVIARMGGEEFLLLLPDTDAVSGAKVVEGLRQAVEAMTVEFEGRVIITTFSAGVTQWLGRSDNWTSMMTRADRAMYAAKHAGRNRITLDDQVLKLPRRAVGVRPEEDHQVHEQPDETSVGPSLRLIRRRLG